MNRDTIEYWAQSRWMPPSPHREAILERVAKGRCHIESQGHGKPPLLVHEDGGVLELHKVRVGSWDLYAEDMADAPEGTTKHVDVCGTVDELENWIKQDPSAALREPQRLEALLQHAISMCRRMEKRWRAYQQFADRVVALGQRMQEVVGPDCTTLDEEAKQVTVAAAQQDYAQVEAHAEAIREVANKLERTLRAYREAATELAALYEEIRGARDWSQDVQQHLAQLRQSHDVSP
ncbi:MAG: hypothetical protein ACUVX8_00615 [Candidatus Zipacnadales bacterium]